MEIVEDKKSYFPADLKLIAAGSLILGALGFVLGVPLLLLNLNLPSLETVEFDTFEHMELSFRYLFRLIGLIGTVLGGYTWISSILTIRRSRVGWSMLVVLYLGGILGCGYLLFRYVDLLSRYPGLPLPSFPIMGLLFGMLGVVILTRKQNLEFLFKKSSTSPKL